MDTIHENGGRRDDRLSPLDATFLYIERPNQQLHVGAVALIDGTLPFDDLTERLAGGLSRFDRYRQRPRRPVFDLGPARWEDDPHYDPRRHIHRVVVPAPGGERELHRTVDELFALPLDHGRPLWDTYVLEGLARGRSAILSKVHHCMIDGVSGLQVLDATMSDASGGPGAMAYQPNGGAGAAAAAAPQKATAGGLWGMLDGVRAVMSAAAHPLETLAGARDAAGAAALVATIARDPARPMPFNGTLGTTRRIVWATFALDDFLAMRGAAGCKVNDVVLAVITGALRRYVRGRGVPPDGRTIRALVPVSVRRPDEQLTLGNRVSAIFADLPLDVADPIARLERIARGMRRSKERGDPRAFDMVLGAAGALPTALAPFVTRLTMMRPLVHTVCTNVPGPRDPRTILGRPVLAIHPIVPLAVGIGLGFAILSYGGTLSICATADAELVPDAERVAAALDASADELAAALGTARHVAATAAGEDGRRESALSTVASLMTTSVTTLAPNDTLADAWKLMQRARIRHLPVTDRRGKLVGLVSHRDLLAASQSSLAFRDLDDRLRVLAWAYVADVMEMHVTTIGADEPAAEAAARMMRLKIGCLPVLGPDGRLAGIVTEEDFLRWATVQMASAA